MFTVAPTVVLSDFLTPAVLAGATPTCGAPGIVISQDVFPQKTLASQDTSPPWDAWRPKSSVRLKPMFTVAPPMVLSDFLTPAYLSGATPTCGAPGIVTDADPVPWRLKLCWLASASSRSILALLGASNMHHLDGLELLGDPHVHVLDLLLDRAHPLLDVPEQHEACCR